MWVPAFICRCGATIPDGMEGDLVCAACDERIAREGDLFRCLTPERGGRLEPFLAQYRHVREQDGYRSTRADYYRALPNSGRDDPHERIWMIRRSSFQRLCHEMLAGRPPISPAVLDLGAGCGWLSHRLALLGCRAVAVDVLTDDRDGLGAGRHYDVRFPRVQADFDALPFAPAQFDLVVFNGSLHYAPDVAATLEHASRMLTAGGAIVVIDSPMFLRREEGRQMQIRLRERFRQEYGLPTPIEPGEGFLTFERLATWAVASGRSVRFFPSTSGWGSRLSRLAILRAWRGHAPARFGVWIAA